MSRKPFMRQYAPLKTPSHWDEEEKRFVRQLCDTLDDIYKRYGRLSLNDLNEGFRGTVTGLESGVASNRQNVTTLSQALNLLDSTKLDASALLDGVYPVGSLYLSVGSASPALLFGGIWERLKDRFLLAAGDTYSPGSTGGEAAHILTEQEMPSHTHSLLLGQETAEGEPTALRPCAAPAEPDTGHTAAAGSSQPHNNLPPYLAVYIWKRTA